MTSLPRPVKPPCAVLNTVHRRIPDIVISSDEVSSNPNVPAVITSTCCDIPLPLYNSKGQKRHNRLYSDLDKFVIIHPHIIIVNFVDAARKDFGAVVYGDRDCFVVAIT